MALLYSQAATATVAANANVVTIAGMDLSAVLPGMVINLGARDRVTGDGYIITAVTLNGSSGGTLTTVGPIPAAFNNAGFVVDTRDFNGTAPNYLIAMYTLVLTTLLRLTSPLTNMFSGSRVLALDKDSAGAVSRLLYAIGGRTWFGAEQRTLTYTPTGGAQTTAETFGLRAYADGTTPSDAILIDLTTGGADVQAASAAMVAAATTDLASAPAMKVAISGGAQIASFGSGKHKIREVHFVDGGNVLVHNATSLILPGLANITTRAGDTLRATSDASGNWRVRFFQRADGAPVTLTPQDARYPRKDAAAALTAGERTQVLNNIGAPYVVASSVVGTSGWRKWSDGSVEQWGMVSTGAAAVSITFPTTFPNACDNVICTLASVSAADAIHTCNVGNYSSTGATLSPRYVTNGGAVAVLGAGLTVPWRAIGR